MAQVLNPVSPGRVRMSLAGRGERNLPLNDDHAEREKNRERRRSSIHGRVSLGQGRQDLSRQENQKLSNESLSALYSSTVKMLQDNKINAKNSWTLNLLDHIDDIVQINDEKMKASGIKTNFQMAGCTLDAGARIYSHRVDSVHNNVFRVRGGLLLGRDDDEAEKQADEGKNGEGKKTGRGAVVGSTLETNIANITTTQVDIDYGVDPLFQKMSAAFDEGGARGMLLNTLSIGAGCEIIFDSNTVYDEAMAVRSDSIVNTEKFYDLGEVAEKLIKDLEDENKFVEGLCPVFTSYRESRLKGIALDPVDYEDSVVENVDLGFEYGEGEFDTATDAELDAEALLKEKMLVASLREDAELGGELAQKEDGEPGIETAQVEESAVPTDFSLFNIDNLRGWAGPSHWRFRGGLGPGPDSKSKHAQKEKRPRGKTAKLLDFETESVDVDFAAEFKPMKNGGELSQGILQKMKEKRNILPDDLHYTTLNLTKLYTRPEISIIARKKDRLADTNEVDVGIDGIYDYDNDCDNENFCPAVNGIDGGDAFEDNPYGDTQLNLVDEPEMVSKVDIKYATVAKKLDVRILKNSIWDDLCDSEEATEKNVQEEGVERSLQEVVQDLPRHVPKTEMPDVSISYVFICLLHLANEKNLKVTGSEDLSDLTIAAE